LEELQGDEAVAPNLLGAMMEADELFSVSPLFSLFTRPGELRTANGLFPAPVIIFGLENTDPPVIRDQRLSFNQIDYTSDDKIKTTKNRIGIV